jgi:hypothetical protein
MGAKRGHSIYGTLLDWDTLVAGSAEVVAAGPHS